MDGIDEQRSGLGAVRFRSEGNQPATPMKSDLNGAERMRHPSAGGDRERCSTIREMPPERLSPSQIDDHLASERRDVCGVVRRLRRMVLDSVPDACEGIRYGALSYFRADVPYGSIGGAICMIEIRRGKVALSFIHGASLPDPHGLLRGDGKAKRFVPVATRDAADDLRLIALVRAAGAMTRP